MADPKENDAIPEEPSDVVEEAEAILEDAAEASETEADAEAPEADELTRAKQEAAAWQDKYMRLHAEWDTYRRRTTEQRQVDKARAAEKIVEGLIPVVDDSGSFIGIVTRKDIIRYFAEQKHSGIPQKELRKIV